MNSKLSQYFTTDEFRCPHCKQITISMKLVNALEELRSACGSSLNILSGYRCTEHNAAIGGEAKSLHCEGLAADVACPKGLALADFYAKADAIASFKTGGIGIYPGGRGQNTDFLHVDVRPKRARWSRIDGKYVGADVALSYLANKGAKA